MCSELVKTGPYKLLHAEGVIHLTCHKQEVQCIGFTRRLLFFFFWHQDVSSPMKREETCIFSAYLKTRFWELVWAWQLDSRRPPEIACRNGEGAPRSIRDSCALGPECAASTLAVLLKWERKWDGSKAPVRSFWDVASCTWTNPEGLSSGSGLSRCPKCDAWIFANCRWPCRCARQAAMCRSTGNDFRMGGVAASLGWLGRSKTLYPETQKTPDEPSPARKKQIRIKTITRNVPNYIRYI